jgi:hypothetical protein
MKGIQVSLDKRPGPFQTGDNHKNGVGSFKNFFFRTTWPILTNLGVVDSSLLKQIFKNLLLQNQLAKINQT